jgi:U-box domain
MQLTNSNFSGNELVHIQDNLNKAPVKKKAVIDVKTVVDKGDLKCPVSFELMKDPLLLSCGHTLDKKSYEDWKIKADTCPLCRKKISHVTENYFMKKTIENLRKAKEDRIKNLTTTTTTTTTTATATATTAASLPNQDADSVILSHCKLKALCSFLPIGLKKQVVDVIGLILGGNPEKGYEILSQLSSNSEHQKILAEICNRSLNSPRALLEQYYVNQLCKDLSTPRLRMEVYQAMNHIENGSKEDVTNHLLQLASDNSDQGALGKILDFWLMRPANAENLNAMEGNKTADRKHFRDESLNFDFQEDTKQARLSDGLRRKSSTETRMPTTPWDDTPY